MRYYLFVFLFCISKIAAAADCTDLFEHLAQAHNVWMIKERDHSGKNSSYKYTKIPKTEYVMAIPAEPTAAWKILAAKDGSSVSAYNDVYGFVMTFKNGQCQNTSQYVIEENKNKTFLYDWKLCEELRHRLKNKMNGVEKANAITAPPGASFEVKRKFASLRDSQLKKAYEDVFSTLPLSEQQALQKLIVKTLTENQMSKEKEEILGPKIIEACHRESDVLDSFKNKSIGSPPPAAGAK